MKQTVLYLLRYLVSGVAPTIMELALIYLLVEYADWWYLLTSGLVYTLGFVIVFLLRKYWVFKNHEKRIVQQAGLYALLLLFNILLNIGLMYALVEFFYLPYMIAQVLSYTILGLLGFYYNSLVIFKRTKG